MPTMKELRIQRGATQADLAGRLGLTQATLCRLESKEDVTVGRLRSYVEALGGTLELMAVFPDASFKLSGLTNVETRDELRALVYKECRLHPMPEGRKDDRFLVRRVDDALVEIQKRSNSQLLEFPIRRVLEVLPATSWEPATIVLRGRLEWSANKKLWDFVLD